MLNLMDVMGFSSTFSLPTAMSSCEIFARPSMMGPILTQGLHQGAQQSTSAYPLDLTNSSKLESVTIAAKCSSAGPSFFADATMPDAAMYARMSCLGLSPTRGSMATLFLNRRRVGIAVIPNLAEMPGASSVLSLPTATFPSSSVESSSMIGPILLQGPHQGAQQSTRTNSLFSMKSSKVSSVISTVISSPMGHQYPSFYKTTVI